MQTGEERRARIVEILRTTDGAVTGAQLSDKTGVSRQAVVNDMAILRAAGEPIVGSPQGYRYAGAPQDGVTEAIACKHDRESSGRELLCFVDNDVTVLDVVVEHQLYGEVRANLMVRSRGDVERYLTALKELDAQPLSSLTGGVHLHHVWAAHPVSIAAAKRGLAALGFLLQD